MSTMTACCWSPMRCAMRTRCKQLRLLAVVLYILSILLLHEAFTFYRYREHVLSTRGAASEYTNTYTTGTLEVEGLHNPDKWDHRQRRRLVYDINCQDAMKQTREDIAWNSSASSVTRNLLRSDIEMAQLLRSCNMVLSNYVLQPLSAEEKAFPIAFAVLVHNNSAQVERLLRAFYRPQNTYCIHVDTKSSQNFHLAIQRLVNCFPNVFVASKPQRVEWSKPSQVLANLACMSDLLRRSISWRYLLNIAGEEFPLRTNGELVQILKVHYPYNDITSSARGSDLTKVIYARTGFNMSHAGPQEVPPPPHGLTLHKGLAYGAFTREFIRYLLTSAVSADLWAWLRPASFTDELYWNTLNGNPQLSPAPPGSWSRNGSGPNDIRAVKWLSQGAHRCRGRFTRQVCIFGVGDLPWLAQSPALIANKFYASHPNRTLSGAFDCIEEWFWNKTAAQAGMGNSGPLLDLTYYEMMKRRRKA